MTVEVNPHGVLGCDVSWFKYEFKEPVTRDQLERLSKYFSVMADQAMPTKMVRGDLWSPKHINAITARTLGIES